MYSHLRGEYTIFAYEKMWINYIKKINLIERLFSDKRNNFFFITNRLEHMKFLAGYAEKIGGNAVFFERDGQFSRKCGARDSFYTMDKKANQLGARNLMGGGDYARAKSKIFIVLNNNNTDDRFFLWNLATAQLKLLTFSPADTNSLFTSRFLPLFCNNRGFKSWGFYLNLFVKAARLKTATKIVNTCSQYSARPHVVFFSRENH